MAVWQCQSLLFLVFALTSEFSLSLCLIANGRMGLQVFALTSEFSLSLCLMANGRMALQVFVIASLCIDVRILSLSLSHR